MESIIQSLFICNQAKKIKVRDKLRNTESLSKEIISLPIYPELKISKVKRISKLINYYFDRLD